MGGKAKWRKLKRVVGPTPQGTQAPAKQQFKKERTKTRDAKRRRMGDAGEEDDDEPDAAAEGSKKDSKQGKDALPKTSSKKGHESSKIRDEVPPTPTAQTKEKDITSKEDLKDPKTTELLQAEVTEVIQESNGIEESVVIQTPQVMVTDLDKDLNSPTIEGLQKPTSEEMLKEELRKATEEECPQAEDEQVESKPNDAADDLETCAIIGEDLQSTQKSTQTEAVDINDVEKPVKFFISDDSDSDTAVFVDAHQAASNGENGQLQEDTVNTDPQNPDEGIEISAVIDVREESTIDVTFEGQDIEFGIEDASEPLDEVSENIDQTAEITNNESPVITQLIDVEPSESPKTRAVQRAKYLPSLAQPVRTEMQRISSDSRRPHVPTKFPFDHLVEGDNISRSSASDSVDTCSVTRSSVSDLADPDNISKTSTNESADQDAARKVSTSDSVDLDTPSVTSPNESTEYETVSKVSVTESADQETVTLSTAEAIDADVTSKMSTVESAEPGTISKSSTRGSIDQDNISKSSVSESGDPDATSKTYASESGEPEFQSKTSNSEYEEAEGVTRTSASEFGEGDSISRTSVSESDPDGTSRTSVSDSVDDTSKTSMTATGTSASATGEYTTSKSSVSYSSEFDAESLSSTADLLTPKEEIYFASDVKAEPGFGESPKLEKESPTDLSETTEITAGRPDSPAWEELNLEDHTQLTEEGGISEDAPPKGDKAGTEADAESLFFSLYPEYQPGEVDESEDAAVKITEGNPKVLCFRGQTPEKGENQEEVYMAAEKRENSGNKDARYKGKVSGKSHQLQRKPPQQSKLEREDKEITEHEGSAKQQSRGSGSEQQDIAEQESQGIPNQGASEPSIDTTRGKSSVDVLGSSTASVTDAKTTKHPISKKKDNLVCVPGQPGERVESLIEATEVIAEVVTDIVQNEMRSSEVAELLDSGAEVGQEALEVENKLEGNAKDRKTLVGKARDWIKGVTRMGGKKEDTNDKVNGKSDAEDRPKETVKAESRKPEKNVKTSLVDEARQKAEKYQETDEVENIQHKTTEQKNIEKEKEESATTSVKEEMIEEEKKQADEQSEVSDSTMNTDNGASMDGQAAEIRNAETDELENMKNTGKDAETEAIVDITESEDKKAIIDLKAEDEPEKVKEEADIKEKINIKNVTEKEKSELEATKEVSVEEGKEEQVEEKADQIEPKSKEEELFDIVSPEEELSDSVFQDDTGDENGKVRESDDTEVQELKADELQETKTEKVTSSDKEDLVITEPVEESVNPSLSKQEDDVKEDKEDDSKEEGKTKDVSPDALSQVEVEKQENEETISKESSSSYVSVQEGPDTEVIATTKGTNVDAVSEGGAEKRGKTTKDELKPRRKRHDKSKSPSTYKEDGKEESPKISRKEKEGKSGSRRRRHRRRTKSHEDTTEVQMAISQAANAAQSTQEPRPEDVALPPDDFEDEKEPQQEKSTEEDKDLTVKDKDPTTEEKDSETIKPHVSEEGKATTQEEIPSDVVSQEQDVKDSPPPSDQHVLAEKRKGSVKSSKDKRHIKKSDEQLEAGSGEHCVTEHKRHSRSRREKSLESKQEKHDLEKLEKDAQRIIEKLEESPREKLQSECEVQSSFTATAATWSPRVGRKDRKSSRKSSDHKREGQSSDRPEVPKDNKDETELSVSSKASSGICDDSLKKSPKASKRVKSKKPEVPLPSTEPREDTPIPSPKSGSQQFKLDSSLAQTSVISSQEYALAGSQPLLQTLTFPEGVSKPVSPIPPGKELKFPAGVSKPVSPIPPGKELKFPAGVSKPISPLPEKKKVPIIIPKPISIPMTLKPDAEPAKPVSPLKTLTFPEGIAKPVSPRPKRVPHPIQVVSSTLEVEKPLPFPAKPVSPLKMLNFPESIKKPVSPLPLKYQEPDFKRLSSMPKVTSSVSDDQESKKETPKAVPPSPKADSEEISKPASPKVKKPRPRIIIPKLEPTSPQTLEDPLEPSKPFSPLKVLKFPEGVSKPVSPNIQKGKQTLIKLDSQSVKKEKSAPEPLELVPDFVKIALPMKEAAIPVSPLRTLTFPAGIPKPVSPLPPKVSQPLLKPIPTSQPIVIKKSSDGIPETSTSQLEKITNTEVSQLISETSKTYSKTITTLTFPEGVSKPVSPIPQKTKFLSEMLKSTQATTKPLSPSSELLKSTQAATKPSSSSSELLKSTQATTKPLSPSSELLKSTQAATKPSSSSSELLKSTQATTKPSPPSSELLKSTQATTKPSPPSSELSETIHASDKPSSTASELLKSTKEVVKPPLIPSEFFKTIHAAEKSVSSSSELLKSIQAVTKPSPPAKELLNISERDSLKSSSPDRSSLLKTFKFPEGVSKPVSPLPIKKKSLFGTSDSKSSAQNIQTDPSALVTSLQPVAKCPQESSTVFTFLEAQKLDKKEEDSPKPPLPTSPPPQKLKISENESKPVLHHTKQSTIPPAPLKIKHAVDFPSDTFPCTKSSSPVFKIAPPPIIKPASPGPKISSPTVKTPSTEPKPASPLPKTASPTAKITPIAPKPLSSTPDTEVTTTSEVSSSVSQSQKSEMSYPKSILSAKLRSSLEVGETQSESSKSNVKSCSPDRFLKTQLLSDKFKKIQTETTKSTISQTHLTYSEVSKRFTPSPRPSDEISKETSATPPMTPPPEPEQPSSPSVTSSKKSNKISTTIQTSEVRSAAKYSRGEESPSSKKRRDQRGTVHNLEDSSHLPKEAASPPATESKIDSTSDTLERPATDTSHSSSGGVHRLRETHQTTQEPLRPSPDVSRSRHEGSHSPKDGSQSPHAGSDSPSKKLRRRKRR